MHILYLVNEENSGPGVLQETAEAEGATSDLIYTLEERDFMSGVARTIPEVHDNYDALVVMGGIMGVYQESEYPFIDKARKLMLSFHEADKPVMGVCLGAQLMASAFGARVYKMGFEEWGFLPQTWEGSAKDDPLLHDATPELGVMQWHGDTFDLPEGAVRLSTREACPNQAFRVGDKSYGFQFHLEMTEEGIDLWMKLRAKEKDAPVDAMRAAANLEALPGAQGFAREVMRRWMRL
ncbi:MAG: glutamine amidotransferase [Parvibaculum sp.]